jgi:hypothetical protein
VNCRRFREKKEAAEPEADPERDQRTVFAYQVNWLVIWIIRSDIVGYLVSCSDYCQCVVVIADALKGNRKGCL